MEGQMSMFKIIRCNLDIKEYIPVGSDNAVSRAYLVQVTGLSDRIVRREIHKARRDTPILNLQNGSGYYRPDMDTGKDRDSLVRYVRQEESRLKSIGWALFSARKTLRMYGINWRDDYEQQGKRKKRRA